MASNAHRLLFTVAVLALSACAAIYKLLPPPAPGAEPGSFRIDGAYARAVEIAWQDLRELRAASAERSAAANDGGTPDPLNVCFARLDAYDAYVNIHEDGSYVVRLLPVVERCVAGGGSVYGGGATYLLSPDFAVIQKQYDE